MAPRKDGSALLTTPAPVEEIKCETCEYNRSRHIITKDGGKREMSYYCMTPGTMATWVPGMAACSWYELKKSLLCESCKWMDEYNPQLGWRCRQKGTWVGRTKTCPLHEGVVDIKVLADQAWKEVVDITPNPCLPILCDKCHHHMAARDARGKRFCAGFGRLVVSKNKCVSYRPEEKKALCPDCIHCKTDRMLGGFCDVHQVFIQGFETTGCTKFKDKKTVLEAEIKAAMFAPCVCETCKWMKERVGEPTNREARWFCQPLKTHVGYRDKCMSHTPVAPRNFLQEELHDLGQAQAGNKVCQCEICKAYRDKQKDPQDPKSAEAYRKAKRKKLEKALEKAYTMPMINSMDRETKTVTVIVPPGWTVVVKSQ